MNNNNHPHANFAASVFSNLTYTRGILKPLLPIEVSKNIDWKTLKLADGSFVDEKLKDYHSDLLFTAKKPNSGNSLNLYILFEHKSQPDYGILQQLLNYQKEVYSRQTKYSPIVPVVFYHGKQKWNIRTNFAQLESADLLPYTLNFSYILINLQEVDLAKIKFSLTSLAILHIFSQIWEVNDIDKLNQYIRFIKDVILRDSNDKLLKLILMYIYRVHNTEPNEVKKLIENWSLSAKLTPI